MRPRRLLCGGVSAVGAAGAISSACRRVWRCASQGKDVRIGGGGATIRQYLNAGLLDEIHRDISPILLGQGESLFEGIDRRALGY